MRSDARQEQGMKVGLFVTNQQHLTTDMVAALEAHFFPSYMDISR